jgi:hypothetical protein
MLAMGLRRGISFFWSPNFDKRGEDGRAVSTTLLEQMESRKKKVRCETMQALQRSLSEAQKIGFGTGTVKRLINLHKNSCANCKSYG